MAVPTKGRKAKRKARKPVGRAPLPVYDLDDLLVRMKPEAFHDPADFGMPAGQEIW
jgi:antitoxin component of MazEF toxin-antitoxin module